jgi:hypothetical protein
MTNMGIEKTTLMNTSARNKVVGVISFSSASLPKNPQSPHMMMASPENKNNW